jgi:hypothetical protein
MPLFFEEWISVNFFEDYSNTITLDIYSNTRIVASNIRMVVKIKVSMSKHNRICVILFYFMCSVV